MYGWLPNVSPSQISPLILGFVAATQKIYLDVLNQVSDLLPQSNTTYSFSLLS